MPSALTLGSSRLITTDSSVLSTLLLPVSRYPVCTEEQTLTRTDYRDPARIPVPSRSSRGLVPRSLALYLAHRGSTLRKPARCRLRSYPLEAYHYARRPQLDAEVLAPEPSCALHHRTSQTTPMVCAGRREQVAIELVWQQPKGRTGCRIGRRSQDRRRQWGSSYAIQGGILLTKVSKLSLIGSPASLTQLNSSDPDSLIRATPLAVARQ